MHLFALETDVGEIKRRFLCEGEEEVLMTYYHKLSFFFACIREMLITVALFVIGVSAIELNAPVIPTVSILAVLWFVFVFFTLLRAFIDWNFDFLFVTTDKVVLVDQTSIIRQNIKPIHLENIGSVTSETQFWNIFRFGKVYLDLKEGEGGHHIVLKYVPNASEVASKISDVVTRYQRRLAQGQERKP